MTSVNALHTNFSSPVPTQHQASAPQEHVDEDAFAHRAPARLVHAYQTVSTSKAGKYLKQPGIYRPLLAGLGATVAVSAVPVFGAAVTTGLVALAGAGGCNASVLARWSSWGLRGGALSAVVGTMLGGKVSRDPSVIDEHAGINAGAAVAATILGQGAQLIARGFVGEYGREDGGREFACGIPQVPGVNLLVYGLGTAAAAAIGHQVYEFARSAANPEALDEEAAGV